MWEKVTITLVDERFVPNDHADSNENLVRNHLLIHNAEKAFFSGLVTTVVIHSLVPTMLIYV
jgi:6-phosphogluconolactonase/Glucosamine-6-phosphate isomerase/deaminase